MSKKTKITRRQVEDYREGQQIGPFLEEVLGPGEKDQVRQLRGVYVALEGHERGSRRFTSEPSYRENLARVRELFGRAIEVLAENAAEAGELKRLNEEARTAAEILKVFRGLQELRDMDPMG